LLGSALTLYPSTAILNFHAAHIERLQVCREMAHPTQTEREKPEIWTLLRFATFIL